MGLLKKNSSGGVMDVIRCDEKDYLIWKWRPSGASLGGSNRENSIRWGSSLRVKQGSVAAFVFRNNEGFFQDFIEGPADTIVDTKNLPIIASIIGLAYNGGSPFQAEVYFINVAETIQIRFAVPYFEVFDPKLTEFSVPVAVRGSLDFNIKDYRQFVECHRLDDFSLEELKNQVRDAVQETMKSIVENVPEKYDIPVIQIERKIIDVKKEALETLSAKCYNDYGINLKDINIVGLEIDKDSEGFKELKSVTKDLTAENIKAKAKLNIKDMEAEQKLGVFSKAANMVSDIKENNYAKRLETQTKYANAYETRLAGRVGAAGAKIISAFKKGSATDAGKMNNSKNPPPVPENAFYVVMYGKTAGPYDIATLKEMAANGSLTPETYVWKEGMEDWTEASGVDALRTVFSNDDEGSSLPPLPKS